MNKFDAVDNALLSVGTAYSLTIIESVLGVALLVVQLGWIGFKIFLKIREGVLAKKPVEEIKTDVKDVITEHLKEE